MQTPPPILTIGASTRGPKALQDVLAALHDLLPTGILIVQHMPVGFTAQFSERWNQLSPLAVRESKGGAIIEPGKVYIATAGWHMTVAASGPAYRTQLSKLPAGTLHTPSADVLMHSVADVFGNRGMGVIPDGYGC